MKFDKMKIVIMIMVALFLIFGISSYHVKAKSNFYGMEVYDVNQAMTAFEVTYNDEGGVSYSYTKNQVNINIYCWGNVQKHSITYTIKNNSKGPIKLNYYTDLYELLTVDGSVYELEMPDIMDYPSKVINPNDSATITFDNPVNNFEDIKYISASLGMNDVFIFLKKIKKKEDQKQDQLLNNGDYKILDKNIVSGIKYSIDLEIPKEIKKNEIQNIFNDIKKENSGYERYFVHFYLSGMEVGSGAWATANYEDSLKITIHGLTAARAKELNNKNFDNYIGVWKDNYMGLVLYLLKEGDNYFIIEEFGDLSKIRQKVLKTNNKKVKFSIPDSSYNEYYLIVDGYLEFWDDLGKLCRYEIIKEPEMEMLK